MRHPYATDHHVRHCSTVLIFFGTSNVTSRLTERRQLQSQRSVAVPPHVYCARVLRQVGQEEALSSIIGGSSRRLHRSYYIHP